MAAAKLDGVAQGRSEGCRRRLDLLDQSAQCLAPARRGGRRRHQHEIVVTHRVRRDAQAGQHGVGALPPASAVSSGLPSSSLSRGHSASSGASTTIGPTMRGWAARRCSVRRIIGTPASGRYCFGRFGTEALPAAGGRHDAPQGCRRPAPSPLQGEAASAHARRFALGSAADPEDAGGPPFTIGSASITW